MDEIWPIWERREVPKGYYNVVVWVHSFGDYDRVMCEAWNPDTVTILMHRGETVRTYNGFGNDIGQVNKNKVILRLPDKHPPALRELLENDDYRVVVDGDWKITKH